MNETRKLAEAQHFLSHLAPSAPNTNAFAFELSAFLSAARSVLQYALEEAKTRSGGQAWYDAQVKSAPEIKYFKDKRDLSIHVQPVEPNRHINVSETASVSFHESLSIKLIDLHGNVVEERNVDSPAPPTELASKSSVSISYHFSDWPGAEDVEILCHRYFAAIKAVVIDGQANGFLST